jgi:uncharacterized protein
MELKPELIDEIIRRILTVEQPERIIMFGSAATGDMGPDSDIDLLVLAAETPDPREESVRIRRVLRGLGYPFDILVMTAERFERTKSLIGGIAYPANKYGKVIYKLGPSNR